MLLTSRNKQCLGISLSTQVPLDGGALTFIIAAILGLAVNLPYRLVVVDAATLRARVTGYAWRAEGVDAFAEAYQLKAELITSLRARTGAALLHNFQGYEHKLSQW
jgi:hypothetical protein